MKSLLRCRKSTQFGSLGRTLKDHVRILNGIGDVQNREEKCSGRGFSTSGSSLFRSHEMSQDLKRFLEEVGTDPREARYWLRHFQQEAAPGQPFAVIEVSHDVFAEEKMTETLASSLAFLYRLGMPVVVIHGVDPQKLDHSNRGMESVLRFNKQTMMQHNIQLVDALERHGTRARPFFCTGNILSVAPFDFQDRNLPFGSIQHVDIDLLKWCLSSGHIPVLTAVGETSTGQVLCVPPHHTTMEIARVLQPMKVMLLNTKGGLTNGNGTVLDRLNIPGDLENLWSQNWYCESTKKKISAIASLLADLPTHSSAVITRADSLIAELFTHHGCGTMLMTSEIITKHHSLSEVDVPRLKELLVRSFNKPLNKQYFSSLKHRLNTLYISESYDSAAIITKEKGVGDIPYLDKFTVGKMSRGQGTSDVLWRKVQEQFDCLFWRSRGTNRINPWYFIRADGSWTDGQWTVFWYGLQDNNLSHKLIDFATNLPQSFDPVAPHDENNSPRVLSSNSYHKFL